MVLNKIGLTGASGMLGYHLIDAILKKNIKGLLTSRRTPSRLRDNLSWRYWDLCQWKTPAELDKLFPEVQVLIHAGALLPNQEIIPTNKETHDANILSCLALAEWAILKEIPIVFISGAVVYDDPYQKNIVEDSTLTKGGFGGFYGYSKFNY